MNVREVARQKECKNKEDGLILWTSTKLRESHMKSPSLIISCFLHGPELSPWPGWGGRGGSLLDGTGLRMSPTCSSILFLGSLQILSLKHLSFNNVINIGKITASCSALSAVRLQFSTSVTQTKLSF